MRGLSTLLLLALSAAALCAQQPRFTDKNEMLLPDGYRHWVLVGSSLGLSYTESGETPKEQTFHHVYLNPDAYAVYKKTGEFPDGSMLAMEVYSAASKVSINRQGSFADKFLRVEVAVKDSKRFDGNWAYFDFGGPAGDARTESTAFAKDRCWSCHNEHGATDNVFTQFYGVLRAD